MKLWLALLSVWSGLCSCQNLTIKSNYLIPSFMKCSSPIVDMVVWKYIYCIELVQAGNVALYGEPGIFLQKINRENGQISIRLRIAEIYLEPANVTDPMDNVFYWAAASRSVNEIRDEIEVVGRLQKWLVYSVFSTSGTLLKRKIYAVARSSIQFMEAHWVRNDIYVSLNPDLSGKYMFLRLDSERNIVWNRTTLPAMPANYLSFDQNYERVILSFSTYKHAVFVDVQDGTLINELFDIPCVNFKVLLYDAAGRIMKVCETVIYWMDPSSMTEISSLNVAAPDYASPSAYRLMNSFRIVIPTQQTLLLIDSFSMSKQATFLMRSDFDSFFAQLSYSEVTDSLYGVVSAQKNIKVDSVSLPKGLNILEFGFQNIRPSTPRVSTSVQPTQTVLSVGTITKPTPSTQSFEATLAVIVISIAAILLLFIFVVLFWRMKRRERESETKSEPSDTVLSSWSAASTQFSVTSHQVFSIPGYLEVSLASKVRMKEMIAQGGAGRVYRAEWISQDSDVKEQKIIVKQAFKFKDETRQRAIFDQEIAIMHYLNTKYPSYFVQLVGFDREHLSMILKYYPKGSMSGWIHRVKWNRPILMHLLLNISTALHKMHTEGFVHCDLKPDNILIEVYDGGDFQAVLTDFGISRIVNPNVIRINNLVAVQTKGFSISYAAPEIIQHFRGFRKELTVDDLKSADLYSLACIMLESACLKRPWSA